MAARHALVVLVLVTLTLSPLTAQFDLVARGGGLGAKVDLRVQGVPGTRFILIPSTQPGPLPLALVDPGDPRSLAVGTDMLYALQAGLILGSGQAAYPLTVPAEPTLRGLTVRFQAAAYPGAGRVFGALSPLRGIHLWPGGTFERPALRLPHKRIFALGQVLADGRVFAAGGGTGAMLALISGPETWYYDPVGRMHTAGPAMKQARGLHTLTTLADGRILAACGVDGLNDPTDTVELFDPTKPGFTLVKARSRSKRSAHTASLLPGGKVLLAGGLSDMNGQLQALGSIVRTTDLFDPTTATFQKGPDMAVPRVAQMTIPLDRGRVLIAGGASWQLILIVKVPYFTADSEIYDPANNGFTKGPTLKVARAYGSRIQLDNGEWLIVGGASGNIAQLGAPTATCEILDAKGTAFRTTGSMATARALAALVRLADGRILAAGGSAGDLLNPVSLTSTEIYDPVKGTWSPGPPLAAGRTGCLQVLLPDGTTLLAGGVGTGPAGSAGDTLEIFHP